MEENRAHHPRYRYSGLFIDISVSTLIFCVVALVMFFGLESRKPHFIFIIYCAFATTFLLAVIALIGFPLLSRKTILPCVNLWAPRHILGILNRNNYKMRISFKLLLGCLMIALPVGVALFNVPLCLVNNPPSMLCIANNDINLRLLYSYAFFIAIYGHCNFSQLGAWPKTAQAIFTAFIFLFTTWLVFLLFKIKKKEKFRFCQNNIDYIIKLNSISGEEEDGVLHDDYANPFSFSTSNLRPDSGISSVNVAYTKCNQTQPYWANRYFGSPLFIWELILDTALAVILVAFLNYQVVIVYLKEMNL